MTKQCVALHMNKITVIGLAGVLTMAGPVLAARQWSVDFTFSPDDVVLTAGDEYTVIGLKDGGRVVDEAGAPSIPAKFANILLPAGAENVSITARGDWTLLAEGLVPDPAQPPCPKNRPRPASVPANDRYASPHPWPANMASLQGVHDMLGFRFLSVRVNPLAYVGAERKLFWCRKVTVVVSCDVPAATRRILSRQARLFAPLVHSLVANPADLDAYAPDVLRSEPKATLDYLIITSASLSNAFSQIADYRASAAGGGYATRVVTTDAIAAACPGVDIQEKIRACIRDSVATLGTTMVLLGGDDTIVPDRDCQAMEEAGMPTDLYYSGLSGNWDADGDSIYGETNDAVDLAWDVVVGRLPMRTARQVGDYLNKVVAYESKPPASNRLFLAGCLAWDSYTGTNRPGDDVTADGHPAFRSTSPPHDPVCDTEAWLRRLYRDGIHSNWPATVGILCDTLSSWDVASCGDYAGSVANTLASFNQNWTHLMFSGHGSSTGWGLETGEFSTSDAMSQTGLTAFVYTDACMTGAFDTETCLGEGFLRNPRPQGGALAYMGCARAGWGSPDAPPADNTSDGGPSTVYAYQFYRRLYETTNRTVGVAFAMHKADMVAQSGQDNCERWIQFGVNLLGDPALMMPSDVSTPAAPVFGANPGPLGATTGVEQTFAVLAGGRPAPAVQLWNATATTGSYAFAAATGVLSYAPPVSDVGAQVFLFRATNSEGVAWQPVVVAVSLALPAAPATICARTTNVADFTATWSDVDVGLTYRLDVSSNGLFFADPVTCLDEDFSAFPPDWTNGGTESDIVHAGASSPCRGLSSNDTLTTPPVNCPTQMAFYVDASNAGNGHVTTNYYSLNGGDSWLPVGAFTVDSAGTTVIQPLNADPDLSGSTGVLFRFASAFSTWYLDDVKVTGCQTGTPSYVAGYSNQPVVGTTHAVTGLTAGATYHFRVRAVNPAGPGDFSPVATVTTRIPAPQPIRGVTAPINGAPMSMEMATTAGAIYALEFTTNLATHPAIWVQVDSEPGVDQGNVTLQDADPSDIQRFYRIVMP